MLDESAACPRPTPGAETSRVPSQSDPMTTTTLADPRAFLTQREVAAYVRLSEITIHRLVEKGLLPCYRLARRVRFRLADVEAYLDKQRHDPSDPRPHGSP